MGGGEDAEAGGSVNGEPQPSGSTPVSLLVGVNSESAQGGRVTAPAWGSCSLLR